MILVNDQVVHGVHERLQELVRRGETAEIDEGIDILDPGIMRIECDEILDAQITELLVHDGGVEGLAPGPVVLTTLIEEGHDDVDAVRLAVDRRDDSLEILEMVVR